MVRYNKIDDTMEDESQKEKINADEMRKSIAEVVMTSL